MAPATPFKARSLLAPTPQLPQMPQMPPPRMPDDALLSPPPSVDGSGSPSQSRPHTRPSSVARTASYKLGRDERRVRSRSRRRKTTWKKLLWVKQSYPDNYTDEETFLDALQRNPRLRPYEFWPLMADSTVIVQQVSTMIVFVCCFAGIIQDRVSPVTIAALGSSFTVLGWVLWDIWVGQEEALRGSANAGDGEAAARAERGQPTALHSKGHSRQSSTGSLWVGSEQGRAASPSPLSASASASASALALPATAPAGPASRSSSPHPDPLHPARTQQRLGTAKSAVLICGALLGLSPILKSLTKSTASDSIWAISFWLMCINVIFYDYSGGVGTTLPASLSTNAALMASTVLASRLQSTAHVFSLTLFSIEVFGLSPIFRRSLRNASWNAHLALTWLLVMSAGAGVSTTLAGGGWAGAVLGALLGSLLSVLGMGVCSVWLISLQRYKNEIHGPWDPARPVLRRWD